MHAFEPGDGSTTNSSMSGSGVVEGISGSVSPPGIVLDHLGEGVETLEVSLHMYMYIHRYVRTG